VHDLVEGGLAPKPLQLSVGEIRKSSNPAILRRVFEASVATSWPAAPVDRIENFPLMLRAALQKAAKRRDLFQQKIILRSASALVAGRFECVRHDIEG
jgi:hypothetical protein